MHYIVYIHIYIYMCVCVCVYQLCNTRRGSLAGWLAKHMCRRCVCVCVRVAPAAKHTHTHTNTPTHPRKHKTHRTDINSSPGSSALARYIYVRMCTHTYA